MNPQIKEKWLNALRSGEYSQGKNQLRNKNNQFCCLGVLCDLYLKENGGEWIELDDNPDEWNYAIYSPSRGEESEVITPEVAKWAELDNVCVTVLNDDGLAEIATLNDEGMSFDEISDMIEKSL